jgi:hypothetical protein
MLLPRSACRVSAPDTMRSLSGAVGDQLFGQFGGLLFGTIQWTA